MDNIIKLSDKHWIYIYSDLSRKERKQLKQYFSTIYPRDYVRELVAALDQHIRVGRKD